MHATGSESTAFGERTDRGWEVRLRPRGVGRFGTSVFLLIWLCGWAVGEAFALWLLMRGAIALLTGEPMGAEQRPLAVGAALAMAAFLIVWLTFWTLGGILAMRELLKSLWAEDTLIAAADHLTVMHRVGPFRSRRELARQGLRRIVIQGRTQALVATTSRATIELSTLGTREERDRVAARLRDELRIAESTAGPLALPEDWQEIITPEGVPAVVRDPRTRAIQARVASVVALLVAAAAGTLTLKSASNPSLVPLAAIFALAAAALTWGVLWLARGRYEWRIGSGSLTLQRRYGSSLRPVFEAGALELTMTTDSDGDEWFDLEALAASTPPEAKAGPRRRRIARAMNDATVPRLLGAWLAQRASLSLTDRTSREARVVEIAALRARLAGAGPLGRWASRLLEQAEKRRAP